MTIVMVLSMCTAVFAATDSATITVTGAENADLKYAQVIMADTTTKTGWKFASEAIAEAYKQAFDMTDEQAILEEMTQKDADGNFTVDAGKLRLAQVKAAVALGENGFDDMTNGQTVTAPGVYLVKATERGWSYNIMAAYVGFNKVTFENGAYKYSDLEDAVLTAKRTPINISKTVADDNNVTHTGDRLTYTITTTVPYISPTEATKTFTVYDKLTGAEYDLTTVRIELNSEDVTADYTIEKDENEEKFSVDLSGMINNENSNAGYTVTITYDAIVTSDEDTVTNKASVEHNNNERYETEEIKTYEGNITLTKTNDPKDGEEATPLAGAKFEVRKDGESDALTFVEIKDADGNVIEYKYDPAGKVKEIVTKADGTVKIKGLDVGKYKFKEIEAPDGYTINTTDAEAELKVTAEGGKATAILTAGTDMKDTKLGSLPSTGGIGTYIFTIAGVVLMACAAGAFFISRKKSEE